MRVVWKKHDGFLIPEVHHVLSEDMYSAWIRLEASLRNLLGVGQESDVLSLLVARFSLGPDVRSAIIEGTILKSKALSPSSAWLFNNALDAVIRFASNKQYAGDDMLSAAINRFGFQARPHGSKENSFLQPARVAGFDVIRTSSKYPSYLIRNAQGQTISVFQQFTDQTSQTSTRITTNKLLTAEVLGLAGLPAPKTFLVKSEAEAVRFFRKEKFRSAVIKPNNTDRGLGVYAGLTRENEILSAFDAAKKYGQLILQEHIDGDDYRLLVVDNELMGVTCRRPFSVVGNGENTVRQLFDDKIKWRASHPFYRNFNNITIEAADTIFMLQKQSLSFDSIPDVGQIVILRSNANVSTGGEHEDVTEKCHGDVKNLALDSARLVGLDLAGIDYITVDITKSWVETSGKICEINPTPALSVGGVPEKLFRRFAPLSPQQGAAVLGDVLYIRGCSCDKSEVIKSRWPGLFNIDASDLSETQYFFQSFLARRKVRCLLVLDRAAFEKYGLVNSNIRTVVQCKNCTSAKMREIASFAELPFVKRVLMV